MKVEVKTVPSDPSIGYAGPDISAGPLPALIYFSLSKEESLGTDPYNQPVQFLQNKPIRVFSFTLPGHGKGFDNALAMHYWAEHAAKNPHFFSDFIRDCNHKIHQLILQNIIDPDHLAVAGLSRGAFIATLLAAENPHIKTILGFAPLTHFEHINLSSLNEKLLHKTLRFYIGNRDTRVSTEAAFKFIQGLADTAYHHKIRSPQVELIITPSTGQHGHGTLPHTFQDGVNWLLNKLPDI